MRKLAVSKKNLLKRNLKYKFDNLIYLLCIAILIQKNLQKNLEKNLSMLVKTITIQCILKSYKKY